MKNASEIIIITVLMTDDIQEGIQRVPCLHPNRRSFYSKTVYHSFFPQPAIFFSFRCLLYPFGHDVFEKIAFSCCAFSLTGMLHDYGHLE